MDAPRRFCLTRKLFYKIRVKIQQDEELEDYQKRKLIYLLDFVIESRFNKGGKK